METPNRTGNEMLRISELADQVGMSVSTAHNYVRRYRDRLHPLQSKRGNLYPASDVLVLRALYEQSPGRSNNNSWPADSLAHESVETELNTENEESTHGMEQKTIQRLEQIEQQFLDTVDDLNAKYRSLLDQFDQLDRVISRSWETQRAFIERMNQSLDRVKQQDRIIDMLMERNKTLETDRARLMELTQAYEEAAAADRPPATTPSAPSEPSAAKKSPEVPQMGFIRRMFRL
jgi:chromosome segregation ATPase